MALDRVLSNPLTEDEANSLTSEEKEWLKAWNRAGEIPGEDGPEVLDPLDPNGVNKAAREALAGADSDQYTDMSNEDLQDELRKRELPVSGNKADLQARLREDDANNAGSGEAGGSNPE
jgi:hypothetical protein